MKDCPRLQAETAAELDALLSALVAELTQGVSGSTQTEQQPTSRYALIPQTELHV